jgi:hypothetical protein
MFLHTKDGIICDYCGTTYKDQFTYYSTRAIEYQLVQNRRSAPKDAGLNSDMCVSCYDMIIKDVEKNLGTVRKDKIKCDLSKTYKSGTFVYYIMYFDKVTVDKEAGEGKDIEIEKNVMDLNIIKGMDKLFERTRVIKEKIESQGAWS